MQELGHGRIETRSIKVAALQTNELDFPGARSIALVTRNTENKKTGKTHSEQVAYISSLIDPDPEIFLQITRLHWTIESSIFGKRDLFFNEDRSTIRTKNGPFNMALLKSFSISMAKLAGHSLLPDAVRNFKNQTPDLLLYFKVPAALNVI